MFIPIPIGAKRIATVQDAVCKLVVCSQCQQEYAYLLHLEATGSDHDLLFLDAEGSEQRAIAQAEQNLIQQSRNVVLPVPCPNCGHYQEDMRAFLRDEGTSNWPTIAGLVIAAVSLVPLAFGVSYFVTIAGVAAGLAFLGCGDLIAARYNPNAGDPEPRKARGRRLALWGEKLADLLAANPNDDHINRTATPAKLSAPQDPVGNTAMTDEEVDAIDRQLVVTMPAEYRAFVRNPPAAFLQAYGGHELFTDAQLVINATQSKHREMIEVRLPHDFVVIGEPETGDFICLNVSQKPATVVEFDHERSEFRTIASSFDSWIRKLSRPLGRAT